MRDEFEQTGQCLLMDGFREKSVLAAVAADAQLGETDDGSVPGFRLLERREQVMLIGAPCQRRLINRDRGDSDRLHRDKSSRVRG